MSDNAQELDPRYDRYKQKCSECGEYFQQLPHINKEEGFIEYTTSCPHCGYEETTIL